MVRFVMLLAIGMFLVVSAPVTAGSQGKSLFERLGGKDAITAVVERFATAQLDDKRIAKFYTHTEISKWKGHLVTLICKATGGPCAYAGRSMSKAHARRNISDEEFNWTAEHLVSALDYFKVPAKEKSEVVAIFVSLKEEVVGQ